MVIDQQVQSIKIWFQEGNKNTLFLQFSKFLKIQWRGEYLKEIWFFLLTNLLFVDIEGMLRKNICKTLTGNMKIIHYK